MVALLLGRRVKRRGGGLAANCVRTNPYRKVFEGQGNFFQKVPLRDQRAAPLSPSTDEKPLRPNLMNETIADTIFIVSQIIPPKENTATL